MNITNARYTYDDEGNREYVKCNIDGSSYFVPVNNSNSDYQEILRQIESGELTVDE